jgi:hypothetical protein
MPDDDYQPQSYQDDLTTDDNATDPIMQEEGEDPTTELGVDPDAFGEELNKEYADGEEPDDEDVDVHDDERENVEDIDDEDLNA